MNNHQLSILIVDDVEMNRDILAQYFSEKFTIYQAENGIEAMEIIDKYHNDISIIILDLQMPIADGYYVLKQMNEKEYSIPVIVATALDNIESEIKAIEMGALDYITKPINPRLLQVRISSALAKEQTTMLQMENQRLITQKEEEERYRAELKYKLAHDELTGLLSKHGFFEETEKKIKTKSVKQLCIVRLGIRDFKIINELFGFDKGDEILIEIANSLAARGNGLYAREYADNFLICSPLSRISLEFLNNLESRLSEIVSGYSVQLTCGIYVMDDSSIDVATMCDRARLAGKELKNRPNERFGLYDKALSDKLISNKKLLSDFDGAMANNEFIIYLQPVVSLKEKKVVAAEALVRWKTSTGLIPPGVFIDVFEKNGKIAMLDYCVWDLACKHLRHRIDSGKREIPFSVNLSRIHLSNPNLVNVFNALLRKYSLPSHLLRLEITETAYVSNKTQLFRTLSELKNSGFTIMMDDFGSGYSSVNMLKDMPVDILKIDMQLIEAVTQSNKAGNIVKSIVNMANLLEIGIVAEGIEKQEQIDYLKKLKCDKIQGYFYSPPLPLDKFEEIANREQI